MLSFGETARNSATQRIDGILVGLVLLSALLVALAALGAVWVAEQLS